MRIAKRSTRAATIACVLALGLFVSACGDAKPTESAAPGGGAASAELLNDPRLPAAPANTDGADVLAAQEAVLAAIGTAKFKAPGAAYDIKEVKKPIWLISASLKFPEIKYIADAFKEAGAEAGVPVEVYDGESDPAKTTIGLQRAADAGAGSVILMSQDPATLAKPISDMQKKGVKLVASNTNRVGITPPAPADAAVAHDYVAAGALNASYAVAKFGADANTLCLTTKEFPVTVDECEGFNDRIKELCPECRTSTKDVQIAQLATQIPATVSNEVRKNAGLNFIQAPFDAAAMSIGPSLRQVGKKPGDVVVGSQNGTPPALSSIKKGDFQQASAGQNLEWWGWGLFDAGARAQVDGALDTTAELVPQRLFTHESMKDYDGGLDWGDGAEVYGLDDGSAYRDGYTSLWKK